jgi:hypothetical protein
MTRFLAQQLAGSHAYNVHAAVRDFNFSPRFTIQQGLDKLQPELDRLHNPGMPLH